MYPKKIVIILENLTEGGGQHMVYELVRNLNPQNFDATVLCYGSRCGTALEKCALNICKIKFLNLSGRINFSSLRRVFSELRALKPDVVHAHLGGMVFAVPWSLIKNTKLVITAHTEPAKAFNKKIEPFIKLMANKKSKKIRIVAVSSQNQKAMQRYLRTDANMVQCVNNGIDIDRFYSKEHPYITFINVARQDENKNQIAILEAFYQLVKNDADLRLILAGDGPCHQKLIDRASELGIQKYILFPGMVSNVEDYYSVSDFYVQSSFREAMPLSALEAMAARLPIISTNVGGMSDIVHSNGVLLNNVEDLEETMRNFMQLPAEEYEKMSEASFQTVQKYSSKEMAGKYEAIYNELLNS